MPRVEEQPDRFAGAGHQGVDLGVRLDDGAHVVMERHPDAEPGHALRERRDLGAVGGPLVGGERGPPRDRVEDRAVRPRDVSA